VTENKTIHCFLSITVGLLEIYYVKLPWNKLQKLFPGFIHVEYHQSFEMIAEDFGMNHTTKILKLNSNCTRVCHDIL